MKHINAKHAGHVMKHMHKEKGGEVKAYDAQGSNVEKEAEEKKRGGRVKKKAGGSIQGAPANMHLGRAHRAKGGRTGSDKSPLTSAAKTEAPVGHSMDSGG